MGAYLKRKIDNTLLNWYKTKGHSPALVFGIRQCGKSRSIQEFARNHFEHVNCINFWNNPEAKTAFEGSLDVDEILKKLSYLFRDFDYVSGKTVFILDEIQDCSRARLALKSFKEDGRFEVIGSGSYFGLNMWQHGKSPTPMPNGDEDVFRMTTMDFEEYLWAKGFSTKQVDQLLEFLVKKGPISLTIHDKM